MHAGKGVVAGNQDWALSSWILQPVWDAQLKQMHTFNIYSVGSMSGDKETCKALNADSLTTGDPPNSASCDATKHLAMRTFVAIMASHLLHSQAKFSTQY